MRGGAGCITALAPPPLMLPSGLGGGPCRHVQLPQVRGKGALGVPDPVLPPPDALTAVPALLGVRVPVPGGAEGPGEEAEEGAEERSTEAAAGGGRRCGSKPSSQALRGRFGPGVPVQVSGVGALGLHLIKETRSSEHRTRWWSQGFLERLRGTWWRWRLSATVGRHPITTPSPHHHPCHHHVSHLCPSAFPPLASLPPPPSHTLHASLQELFFRGILDTQPGTGVGGPEPVQEQGCWGPLGRSGRADRPAHVCRVNPEVGQEGRRADSGILEPPS